MMDSVRHNADIDRLRSYSTVFSRSVFTRLIKFNDCTAINNVGRTYDGDLIERQITYADYLDRMYLSLVDQYRTEYVLKNALSNKIVSLNKGRNITLFNEFRVGDSIADTAAFNGKSCVYEIKTELDSPKRLGGQQESYFKFFQECYLVVPRARVEEYIPYIDERMGIMTVNASKHQVAISKYRKASHLTGNLDIEVLMRILWISEYEFIIKQFYGKLPDVGYYEMFDACAELMGKIPQGVLSKMVVDVIKKRKHNDLVFDNTRKCLTQICLALNINHLQYHRLCENLSKTIMI